MKRDWISLVFFSAFFSALFWADSVWAISPIQDYAWYLKNKGTPLGIVLDDLTTLSSPSRAGEDLGLGDALTHPSEPTRPIKVAIIDTGLDTEHPELKAHVHRNESECAALAAYLACGDNQNCKKTKNVDTNQDGYPLNCTGWNITAGRTLGTSLGAEIYGNSIMSDEAGHGTHVAGLVHAVAPFAKLVPVKVIRTAPNSPIRPQDVTLTGDIPAPTERELRMGTGFADTIARGILYAIRERVDIINLSLAWPKYVQTSSVKKMIELASKQGILVFAAAGNDNTSSAVFPCQMTEVICVGAIAGDGALTHFSNFGSFVDVAAPGIEIISTWPTSKRSMQFHEVAGYEKKNGTSMASPLVAGVAAQLLSRNVPAAEVKLRLLASARPLQFPLVDPSRSRKWLVSGSVDLERALAYQPGPYFIAAQKRVLEAPLADQVRFQVRVKNIGTPVPLEQIPLVSVKILDEEGGPQDLLNAQSIYNEGIVTLDLDLSQIKALVPGRLIAAITLQTQTTQQTIKVPLELYQSSQQGNGALTSHPIAGLAYEKAQGTLRTFLSQKSETHPDYLLVTEGIGASFTPIFWDTTAREYRAQSALTGLEGELLLLQKFVQPNGAQAYSLVFRKQSTVIGANPYTFDLVILNSAGALDQKLTLGSEVALSERFEWLAIGGKRFPVWIGLGKSSAIDLAPPFTTVDAWDPEPENTIGPRLYVLTPEGLRSYAPPALGAISYEMIALVPNASSDGSQTKILLAENTQSSGAIRRYFTQDCTLRGYRSAFTCSNPTSLPRTQNITLSGGMDQPKSFSLTPDSQPLGAPLYFAQPTTRGRVRLVGIQGGSSERVLIDPQSPLDSIMQVIGVFTGSNGQMSSAFATSHSHLLYFRKDATSNRLEQSSLSLDRFSFLPSFIVRQTAFPFLIGHGVQEQSSPLLEALLIPEGMGSSRFTEILVPHPLTQKLSRLAALRFESAEECSALAQPIGASHTVNAQLVYYCVTDQEAQIRMLRIPAPGQTQRSDQYHPGP